MTVDSLYTLPATADDMALVRFYALAVAGWVRRHHPEGLTTLHDRLFLAHFSLGEDIGDSNLIDSYARQAGADVSLAHHAWSGFRVPHLHQRGGRRPKKVVDLLISSLQYQQ